MNVLLLGGTGAMGKPLATKLNKDGINVYITSRSSHADFGNIHYLLGNAHSRVFLESVLRLLEWDAIVDFMVYNTTEFSKKIDLFLSSTKQYVLISSCRVFANIEGAIVEESPRLLDVCNDTKFLKSDDYSLSKAREENILKKKKSKNWTIVRPYITYDAHRLILGDLGNEGWLYRALKGRSIIFSRDMASKLTSMAYGSDISYIIASLLGNKKALGETFNLVSPYSCTWKKILTLYMTIIEEETGNRPKLLMLEEAPIPQKYMVCYDRIYNRVFDNSKISKYVKHAMFKFPEEGIKTSMKDFFKSPSFKKINWMQEAMFDNIANEKTPFKEIAGIKNKIIYVLFRYIIPYKIVYMMRQNNKIYDKILHQ